MPRYFFHTSDGSRDQDDVGVELNDAATARREAIRYGGSLLHDNPEIVDAHAYALEINGDSMQPVLRAGDTVIVSPQATARDGCYWLIQMMRLIQAISWEASAMSG